MYYTFVPQRAAIEIVRSGFLDVKVPLQGSTSNKERLPVFYCLGTKGYIKSPAAARFKKFLQTFLNGPDLPLDLLLLVKGPISLDRKTHIGELALFAMYHITISSVRTYIANTPKPALYVIL